MVSSGEVAGSEDEREPDWESSIAADAVLSSLSSARSQKGSTVGEAERC